MGGGGVAQAPLGAFGVPPPQHSPQGGRELSFPVMSQTPILARLVRITGRVQGVGYRAWTVREATTRGLEGWVRNRPDGSVEALFVGPEAVVGEMIECCRGGPRHAAVSSVQTIDIEPPPGIRGFHQRPTA